MVVKRKKDTYDSGIRLKSFLASEKIGQATVARMIDRTPQYVGAVCNGYTSIGKKLAATLEEKIGVSASWLLTGTGSRHAECYEPDIMTAHDDGPNIKNEEKQTTPVVPIEQQTVNIIDLYSNLISEVADLKLQLKQSITEFNAATDRLESIIKTLQK